MLRHLEHILCDFAVVNDATKFLQHSIAHKALFTDHLLILVVRVVGISKLATRVELELKELVTEDASVTHTVTTNHHHRHR
jgi:hypothetical protein